MINEREKAIIQYILMNQHTTITKIAKHMNLSNKTVSQSLKLIDELFRDTTIELIRKPRIGVSIIGDPTEILRELDTTTVATVPASKKERIQFLCFELLKKKTYFTRQELQDTLFVSKSTLEGDMNQVHEIFRHFNVSIDRLPGKGSFLNLSEQEKRRLAFDLIYYFWGSNWKITKKKQLYLHSIQGIPPFVNDFIDMNNITLVDTLLQEYLKDAQTKLNDTTYHSLLLHLLIMIDRVREDNYLETEEVYGKIRENKPFDLFILKLEKAFSLTLPSSEVHYIQLHLEGDTLLEQTTQMKEVTDKRIRLLIHENVTLYSENILLGLVMHIKEAVLRIQKGLLIHNPFLQDVKKNFPASFTEAIQLANALSQTFAINVPEDEVAFIAVHIQAMKEQTEEKQQKKISVLLVCSSGKGTSQLLAARIRRNYEKIEISRILSIQELMQTSIYEDLVISTVNLNLDTIPTINVSPVLNKLERQKIELFLENAQKKPEKSMNHFANLIKEDLIFLDHSFADYQEVIQFIGKQLIEKGYAEEEIISSSLEREQLSFTSFGKFATPHGAPKYVKKSAIVFLRLANELMWGETKVKYLFFICIKDETAQELEEVYDTMLEIIESGEKKYLLKGTKTEIKNYLKEEF
ncbi:MULTISPECIES: BglG family transcription antiterminator [unclassified Enterococcus]|uniref:BglG family transcription antiterminator n=1 Tax=unclassified Enterococcus TaxID=2608891 RepID=UPI001A9BF18E|nr:BglG family transcription antiterminator [Enterococcus sp. DIV1271a]MBO1299204.1 transcription antiterminator [Enterococcus sp. DIV1271a]